VFAYPSDGLAAFGTSKIIKINFARYDEIAHFSSTLFFSFFSRHFSIP